MPSVLIKKTCQVGAMRIFFPLKHGALTWLARPERSCRSIVRGSSVG